MFESRNCLHFPTSESHTPYASAANHSIPCDLLWFGLDIFGESWHKGEPANYILPSEVFLRVLWPRYLLRRVISTLCNILVKLVSCYHSFIASLRGILSHNSHELNRAVLQYWRGWLYGRVRLTGHSRRPLLFGWVWTKLNGLSRSVAQ